MRYTLTTFLLFINVAAFAQGTDNELINKALKLFCQEEVLLNCIESDDNKRDTICFYSTSFEPTSVVKASKRLYYQISNDLQQSEQTYNCIIGVGELFNAHNILMLRFKVLKTRKEMYMDKPGLVRCQIVDGRKISFVDARFNVN